MRLAPLLLSAALICSTTAAGQEPVPYDACAMRWTFDPAELVSAHDVAYERPPYEPWEAMPVGGGDLSAMVRCTGGSLILHLTKSDAWGFQAPPDAPMGSRFFNNVSPGTVTISLGDRAAELAAKRFRQRMDLYRGRIVVELGEGDETVTLSVWGDPDRTVLLVALNDPKRLIPQLHVELAQWRDSMRVWAEHAGIGAVEIHTRPARPHLANTGMEEYFVADQDPLCGRGTAVAVAANTAKASGLAVDGQTASMSLTFPDVAERLVAVSCAVAVHGDPTRQAQEHLHAVLAQPTDQLDSRRDTWWKQWWDKSFLGLTGTDPMAKRLCGAYHVHLYTLGCTNRGSVPCKWDGGPGLMRGDERTWGLAEWVQEIRFTYMPLYAANRMEMAKGLTDHYTRMQPYLRRQTETMWDVDGLWIPETVLPWGHAEDFVLQVQGPVPASDYFLVRDPETLPFAKFERFNGYVGLLFTAGLEIGHHYLEFHDFFADEAYLREEAYPVVREVCRFVSGLLRKEEDGLYHLEPANALETWWLVRNPTDTLDAVRAIFPRFISLCKQYGADAELREKCEAILAHLPQTPRTHWDTAGDVTADPNSYAPAASLGPIPDSRNFEIPALYRVYPFGLSGIGSADREVCIHTFNRRIFGITNSWSLDAVWAARLGLKDEAARLIGEHAQRYHRFPYGGWDSSNSSVWPGGLSVCPYVDGAGLSAFCLQEMLLQSHEEAIRILPATPNTWNGLFRLRARGGLIVSAYFAEGAPVLAEIESLTATTTAIHHPWASGGREPDGYPPIVVRSRGDTRTIREPGAVVRVDIQPGEKILLYEPGTF
jgi:alpha-L-fucosidase 2